MLHAVPRRRLLKPFSGMQSLHKYLQGALLWELSARWRWGRTRRPHVHLRLLFMHLQNQHLFHYSVWRQCQVVKVPIDDHVGSVDTHPDDCEYEGPFLGAYRYMHIERSRFVVR